MKAGYPCDEAVPWRISMTSLKLAGGSGGSCLKFNHINIRDLDFLKHCVRDYQFNLYLNFLAYLARCWFSSKTAWQEVLTSSNWTAGSLATLKNHLTEYWRKCKFRIYLISFSLTCGKTIYQSRDFVRVGSDLRHCGLQS